MYTMLVWQWIPENVQVYVIPNDKLTAEQNALLDQANGYLINGNGDCLTNDGLNFLNQALLEDTPQNRKDNVGEKYVGCLGLFSPYRQYDQNKDPNVTVLKGPQAATGLLVTRVVVSGFVL